MEPAAPPAHDHDSTAAAWCDRWLAGPMFWLALAFLILAAGVLHRIGYGFESIFEFELIAWALVVLWPVFLAEGLLRLCVCIRHDKLLRRLVYQTLIVLAPPLRMGCRSYVDAAKMWLPVWGCCAADRHLRRRLEQFFSVPMMVIAFLVLPVLALEHFWAEQVQAHFAAKLLLDIASSIIWMAFAAEFILMISVADKKLRYCLQNWMDLAIVVLPLFEALPLLRLFRLTRLMELQQLTRLGRLYRLRGLLFKLWRAILLLDILHRLLGNQKEKRLRRLKELLSAKLDELADLHQEIDDLERELATAKPTEPIMAEPSAKPAGLVASTALEDKMAPEVCTLALGAVPATVRQDSAPVLESRTGAESYPTAASGTLLQ